MQTAIRRHHYHRLQNVRSRYWLGDEISMTKKQKGIVVATPNRCSKSCCGNPRKYFNQSTVQERRNFQEDI